MREITFKKCTKCGALVQVLEDCSCQNCGITCCGEQMQTLNANSKDFSAEKHTPTYQVVGDKIEVTIPHDMTEAHHINWIMQVTDHCSKKVELEQNKPAVATFKYVKGAVIYSYCNLHGLWMVVVE